MTDGGHGSLGIALVGYRATGKSTVGRIVAERLGRAFADVIINCTPVGMHPDVDVFEQQGEPAFRDWESRVLSDLTRRPAEGWVIATGGGAILLESNRQVLREFGFVAWLTADPDTLNRRLRASRRALDDRPALTSAGTLAEIASVLEIRTPFYREVADVAVPTEGRSPEQVADAVLEAWSRLPSGAIR